MQVRDIMQTNVITIDENASLQEAAQVMDRHRVSGVPVTGADGTMVGLISEYDLIAKPDDRTVRDAMTRDVISVMEETDLETVRFLLVQRRIKRVPVLRGQQVVGIVSRADLVHEIAQNWVCQVCGEHAHGTTPPESCPRCGAPTGFHATSSPPVGEGSPVGLRSCPTCGQRIS